jgi:hypothetical protein
LALLKNFPSDIVIQTKLFLKICGEYGNSVTVKQLMIKMFEPTTTARQDNISKGQTEKHSHNRLAGQDRTTRKGRSGQEGQPGRDRRERAGRETRPGKVSQTRLLELDSQDRTGQSGKKLAHYQNGFFLPGDNCQRSHFFLYMLPKQFRKKIFLGPS